MTRHSTHEIHRARALAYAVLLLGLDGVALTFSLRGALGAWHDLRHTAIAPTPLDAVPTVAWSGAACCLLWGALLLLLASHHLATTSPHRPSDGDARHTIARRIAGLLLAMAALGTAHSTAAATTLPAAGATIRSTDTTGHPADAGLVAPDPSFTARCEPPPEPSWTPAAPEPPDQRAADCAPLVTGSAHTGEATVTVRRGDSLWSIVARHLGPDADAGTVAAVWPTWYAANRALIGDDPDLLLPGWQLRVPQDAR